MPIRLSHYSTTTTAMWPALLLLLPLLPRALAADNGMDMDMDNGMTLAMGSMINALHFGPVGADTLWFPGWVPQSAGAVAGACVGLFLLALVDRWLAACRAMMEVQWRAAAERARKDVRAAGDKGDDDENNAKTKPKRPLLRLRAPPFIPAHDIMRGALHALQAALGFAFMLAVMTFQAGFIIAIALGLGVGEMLFGRYAGAVGGH
ncbi:Ctr copper transporter family-domain-containing protein [Mycena rebaudengoi]|nr:Ctr copper transporter family-domain-containing protein [Mycena rebaudengoi]